MDVCPKMLFSSSYINYLQSFKTLQVLKSMCIDFLELIVTDESTIERLKVSTCVLHLTLSRPGWEGGFCPRRL